MEDKQKEPKNKNVVVVLRIFQAISLGIFALGISMIAGDYTAYIKSFISTFSITTTLFGLFGAIITQILIRSSDKW